MSERRDRGLFIVIEGIDNSGKTTQSILLKEYLEGKGLSVIQTREPGGTEVGEEIRQVLLKPREQIMDPVSQALLFYAARQEFLNNVVKPNLERGISVITDRFEASTFVYQGYTQSVNGGLLEVLSHQVVTRSGSRPNLMVILDIPAEESFIRGANEDRVEQDLIYEKQGLEFARKLREGYLKFAKRFDPPQNLYANKEYPVIVVDGMQPKEQIHQQIVNIVEEA